MQHHNKKASHFSHPGNERLLHHKVARSNGSTGTYVAPGMPLFVVYRVRDLEAMIGMVVPTHPHAVASLALHARQSVSSFHSLVKRLVKAKSLVDVLNCLIRFKDINASIRLTIRGISVDSEIASVIATFAPRRAILVVQRLEIRPLGLALTATIPTMMATRARAATTIAKLFFFLAFTG